MINYPDYHIEIECAQFTKDGESVCGDYFELNRISNEKRCLAVLSDGLGSGVKANILASLTTTMALRFFSEEVNLSHAAEIIMDTLPVCEERKISYATFTAVDIMFGGKAKIIEMDNPPFIHIRNKQVVQHDATTVQSENWPNRAMTSSEFNLYPEDRIVFFSDGVTQAGVGTRQWNMGWGHEAATQFICETVAKDPEISAGKLASSVIKRARLINPGRKCYDDTSCVVVYFRRPRKLIVASGPPFRLQSDPSFASMVADFDGRKAICGGTTASIIAREMGIEVEAVKRKPGSSVPPGSKMEGIDLVTEGVMTLTETARYLENDRNFRPEKAVENLTALLLDSDVITFVIGTKVNEAHLDPSLPFDLEIRRNIIKRIITCLQEKYHKEVNFEYL